MKQETENLNNFKAAYKKIKDAENIFLVTHERPDGDAYASVCAMIDILESLEKNCVAYCQSELLDEFYFLPLIEKIKSDKNDFKFRDYDLIIMLDCGSLARCGLLEEIKNKKSQFIIDFDHHPKDDIDSDIELRNTGAVSTTEILYDFFKANKIKITKNIANCILTGILHDTDSFFHQSVSAKTLDIASEMLVYGAQFPKITNLKWHNKSLDAMKLWGTALSNLCINKEHNLAYTILTLKETSRFDVSDDIFNSITNFISNLSDVKAIMLLREEKNSITGVTQLKGSLRSVDPRVDVSQLAKKLGGGGHPMASGFLVEGRLEKTGTGWIVK